MPQKRKSNAAYGVNHLAEAGAANPQRLLHIYRPGCRARGLRHLSMEPRLMLRSTQKEQVFVGGVNRYIILQL